LELKWEELVISQLFYRVNGDGVDVIKLGAGRRTVKIERRI